MMDYEQINISSDEFNSDDETDNEKLPCTKVKMNNSCKDNNTFLPTLPINIHCEK